MTKRWILHSILTVIIAGAVALPQAQAASIEGGDIVPWQWTKSTCQDCGIIFEAKHKDLQSEKVQSFIHALEDSKTEITALYKSNSQEYNLLAHMAIGILGRESKFFKSLRYLAKEEMQAGVSLLKTARSVLPKYRNQTTTNSRGPTQIKEIPKLIADYYHMTSEDLDEPENAARATMGFLIEALRELKQRVKNNNLDFVTKSTYVDYLPYIYFGATHQLLKKTATPEQNMYIKAMKTYMSWVRVYEYQPPK